MNLRQLLLLIPLFLLGSILAIPSSRSEPKGRRLQVLFFGAPTGNHPGHDPVSRYRAIKRHLGTEGIDFTYLEDPDEALNGKTLERYDAILMYGNWDQGGAMPADQLDALTSYVDQGGAFLPIHCASACYGGSPDFIKLVGGRFKSHGEGVFKVATVNKDHPVMRGYRGYSAWDETYVHDQHADDRVVLEKRGEEPWTWVREQGRGRVFYTAAGHDHRVWDLPEFQEFMKRAILWSVGPDKRKQLLALALPKLEQEAVQLPGYLKRELITKAQKPLSPQDSLKLAQVPVGFGLSLFASEPDIVNPIFVGWDHRGRAFVVQTIDYPNNLHAGNLGNDRITICEDTNGDGHAEKFTVFADKLSIPTSLVFTGGGVICTNGSEMLFLQDTDGDDRADVRKVLFSGFNMGDTHAGVSNLRYGHDGWIYATVGYSGFNGTVGGEQHSFSQSVFRFLPDGSKLEVLQGTTNNTWGLGTTSDFDVMGSTANGNPSFYLGHPQSAYAAAGMQAPRTPRADEFAQGQGNASIFNPSSSDIRQVDFFESYTAAAGHALYTAGRFPEAWHEKTAFVTEATGKLVGIFKIRSEGAGFRAVQQYNNLYNSADAWSGPVCAEVGPDGAVWICDWYNLIIQHNPTPSKQSAGLDATAGKGNAYETPVRKDSMGRIYRIYPKDTRDDPNPKLDPREPDNLISALNHPNLLWRLHAQRLLIERGNQDVAEKLRTLAASGKKGSSHAIYALAGLGVLDAATVSDALQSTSRSIQRSGIHCATPAQLKNVFVTGDRLGSLPPRELADVFVGLSKGEPDPEIAKSLFTWAVANEKALVRDPVLKDAWQIAANCSAEKMIQVAATAGFGSEEEVPAPPNLLPNPDFTKADGGLPAEWTKVHTHGGAGPPALKVSLASEGRGGSNCLKIESPAPSDSGPAAAVKVAKHTRYRLSAWIRTVDLKPYNQGPGALLNIQGGNRTNGVKGTSGWTQVSMEFDSEDTEEVVVNCLFGGYGGATGTAFFDDLSLVEIAGGSGLPGLMRAVSMHFLQTAGAPARQSMGSALVGKSGGFARKLSQELTNGAVGGAPPNPVKKTHVPDAAIHERGKAVYAATCIACHQLDGKGMTAAFPPLDGSAWVTGDLSVPVRILLHGLTGPVEVEGQKFESVMPAHADLDDQKISDVLTYVRQSWGNDASAVSPAEVKTVRERHSKRNTPWTAPELGH